MAEAAAGYAVTTAEGEAMIEFSIGFCTGGLIVMLWWARWWTTANSKRAGDT